MKKLSSVLMLVLVMSLTACGSTDEAVEEVVDETVDETTDTTEEVSGSTYDYDIDPYVSEEGRFSIKFMGDPGVEVDPIDTDFGSLDMYFYSYEESLSKAYLVSYIDYPLEVFDVKEIDLILEDAAAAMAAGMTIDVIEDTSIDGYPGKTLSANDGEMYMDVDMYLVDNRLYQVAILDSYSYAVDSLDYLGSFELL